MHITKHLDLNVSEIDHKFLEKHHLIPEGLHSLPLGAVQLLVEDILSHGNPHPLAATPPHCLDPDGLVRHCHVHTVHVRVAVHRHCLDPEALGCPHDVTRVIAPVGDAHLVNLVHALRTAIAGV